jgi:hypothetical protein
MSEVIDQGKLPAGRAAFRAPRDFPFCFPQQLLPSPQHLLLQPSQLPTSQYTQTQTDSKGADHLFASTTNSIPHNPVKTSAMREIVS